MFVLRLQQRLLQLLWLFRLLRMQQQLRFFPFRFLRLFQLYCPHRLLLRMQRQLRQLQQRF